MKLHLGCGEKYLKDYINIDYPGVKHTVQKKSVADKFIDILDLAYPPNSVDEIRLHHTFEHFPRHISCALLTCWHTWLKPKGVLHIEVPDFAKMAKQILNPLSSPRERGQAQRHIFGSQEAMWATHFSGYTSKSIKDLVEKYGFKEVTTKKNTWKKTANIELFAVKQNSGITPKQFDTITRKYLKQFLIDDSATEKRLFEVWMAEYAKQVRKSNYYEKK